MPITLATHAMGTRFELVLDGADDDRLRPAGEAALGEIDECHARFNLFGHGSWLNTINRRAAREPAAGVLPGKRSIGKNIGSSGTYLNDFP